jgi:hypothetical protein
LTLGCGHVLGKDVVSRVAKDQDLNIAIGRRYFYDFDETKYTGSTF